MNLFEHLAKSRPAEPTIAPPSKEPAQQLLTWLQTRNQPTITASEILLYGPRPTRNRKDADAATEILVKHGWLVPQKTNQSNRRRWQITRKPLIRPTLAD